MSPSDFERSSFFRSNTWVRVKNAAATTIPPHSVVLITGSTKVNNDIVYTVQQPNAASTDFNWNGYLITGPAAIGASTSYEGIATDATAPTLACYDTGSPALKDVYGPKHGQFTLSKNYYGYEVVGSATTSINSVVPVRWIGVGLVLGKTDAEITSGNSGTVSVWAGTPGSEADTSMNIASVYNRGSATVSSGDWVLVVLNGGNPYLLIHPSTGTIEFHRGVTDAAINKGASGTVSRYTAGTTTDSGTNDTVNNDFANVAISKKVAYIKSGANYYMIAAEC
jgi:hypothetical protein